MSLSLLGEGERLNYHETTVPDDTSLALRPPGISRGEEHFGLVQRLCRLPSHGELFGKKD